MSLRIFIWSLLFIAVEATTFAEEITRLPLENGTATLEVPADGLIHFLRFGDHSYEPDSVKDDNSSDIAVTKGTEIAIAPFQELRAIPWQLPAPYRGKIVNLSTDMSRDAFGDQILVVEESLLRETPKVEVEETGDFFACLPPDVNDLSLSETEIATQQASLSDPIIPDGLAQELTWDQLASAGLPLDFQKVLLASPHDASPAFAYQNGQWLTTWTRRDLDEGGKEDHWFAPVIKQGDRLIRPAPLSAATSFSKSASGRLLPEWNLAWSHEGATVRQAMFSYNLASGTKPILFVQFQIENAPPETRLALGVGRRPNAHFWDNKNRERTPIPFFSLEPSYRQQGRQLIDAWDRVVLESRQDFTLEKCGPLEMLLVFTPDKQGRVELATPQVGMPFDVNSTPLSDYASAEAEFQRQWEQILAQGAQVKLPSSQWQDRVDAWQAQIESITRVNYQGRDRLSYGAYFYQYYFGIEEAWPVVALAQWGRGREAQRQAEIMLQPQNLDKSNVHHQSRNGAAPWAAAVVARLTNDPEWLTRVAPAMIECAEWTSRVRREDQEERSPLTCGLLPPHIYGGDIRDPATSLYATAICWKGIVETADVLAHLGGDSYREVANKLRQEAKDLRNRIDEVMGEVALEDAKDVFLPLALELPSLNGKHEGPYEALTDTRLGNYWNLFAPSLLQLQMCGADPMASPDRDVFEYMQHHGGLWASLPRFYNGLDVAYAGGIIGYLLNASALDPSYRPQALAALEAYFLHAASRNGYTIPEVAGLFPDRLDRAAYERLVRESPWSFGMYDAQRYLEGHISFTEPLGAGAGQALWLIRDALVTETRTDGGLPDGGLVILPTVPSAWFEQGKHIELNNLPTAYGMLSARIESQIEAKGEITMAYSFKKCANGRDYATKQFRVRFAPPGKKIVELEFDPQTTGVLRANF
ncbi:hypothetical protein [Bythopirellula polymerisocia]|uniref:Uncharacterized protein n=1 Tax=Bythopirellula polymerisocia TaxID=2528003 RepID=A0A5C6CZ05_9BACT|nr:hypothetical protein [Bythopirellula polymerisocia]TWU30163.1 hypothetical protein Pla144_09490 [Bythopirellula polymerisocia]